MKVLCAEIWVGEYGWECFCYQGYLRKLSKQYDTTLVACREGHEILYEDFATTIPLKVDSDKCDMWMCHGYKVPPFKEVFGDIQADYVKPPLLRYDHTHKLDKKPLFAKFYEQEFVMYGKPDKSKTYDILIHARSKKNEVNAGQSSNYRNWSLDNWAKLLDQFSHLKIGFIGTKDGADYLGHDDLRGIPLRELADILASSNMLVSPSSGPVHFAALCGCPHITWCGEPYGEANRIRYDKDWNPLGTPYRLVSTNNWQPSLEDVVKEINSFSSLIKGMKKWQMIR